MLAPGHCQVETWFVDSRRPTGWLAHVGPACHAAGVEWGLNADRAQAEGVRADLVGPQAKWVADIVAQRLAAGAVLGVAWRTQGPVGTLATAYVPLTAWVGPQEELQLNLNLGRDRDSQAGGFRRWGVGADWSLGDRFVLTVERREILGQRLSRAGVRWNLGPTMSIDASLARAGDTQLVGLGFNWEWTR
jgi:hypothetical protein